MDAFVKRLPRRESTGGGSEQLDATREGASAARPAKRIKREEIGDSDSDGAGDSPFDYSLSRKKPADDGAAEDDEKQQHKNERATDFENAFPPTQSEEEALEEYEAFKSSQASAGGGEQGASEKTQPTWIRGRSSIYVDAFNLALDTVLEEESSLFDDREMEIFRQWKDLDYESQYLYVRLFLRKTAAWHRSSRIGYYNDISDPDTAINTLQKVRELPASEPAPLNGALLDSEHDVGNATSFTFADTSDEHIKTVEDAASLLSLDELKALAKEAKINGRTKAEFIKGLGRVSQQQTGLMALGISRQTSRDSSASEDQAGSESKAKTKLRREDSNREQYFLTNILAILGPCIRLSPLTFHLFERVHLVFYRSTEWTEKSLTTIILAKIARRNFPKYIVCRTSTIFASRGHLLEFEAAIRLEADVDGVLESGGNLANTNFQKITDIFDKVYTRWKALLIEEAKKEVHVYEMGEGAYLRRFNPAHSYTRIVVKSAYVFGKLKNFSKEYELLNELLDQRLFHLARRGAWYQRKALLEEHYMAEIDPKPASKDPEQRKKHWKIKAASTCEAGLQDPDCHLTHHYDLQKRLIKLEKKLRIPRRLQHDFGHVTLAKPLELFVEGVQLKKDIPAKAGALAASTKTVWLDELDTSGECSVEEMCLSHFRSQGWKGYHAEGGIVRTLFAYLFYDILFLYIPNVFQTAFQTCPLDLHTDAFFPARASEINHRLVEIANGEGQRILRGVWEQEHEKQTSVIGLNWEFEVDDLVELVGCFEGSALAALCKVMAQEYKQRGGGIPDLILWRTSEEEEEEESQSQSQSHNQQRDHPVDEPGRARGEVMFAEVKSANDRLSDTQRLWIHVLTGAGVKVALCNAVAREVRDV